MNSEHVFQIGISVDDDAITKAALEAASKVVVEGTTRTLLRKTYGSYNSNYELSETGIKILSASIDKLVAENKDLIISMVVEKLTRKMMSSKTMRDKCGAIDVENIGAE